MRSITSNGYVEEKRRMIRGEGFEEDHLESSLKIDTLKTSFREDTRNRYGIQEKLL